MPKRKGYDDNAQRARAIVRQEDEIFYESMRSKFLSARGEMLMSIVEQGRILAQLRERSSGFLRRIAAETDDNISRLEVMADFWQYFHGELPREDVSPLYYLALSKAIRLIEASWRQVDEVTEVAIETGRELILDTDRSVSPSKLAAMLRWRFGILEPGNHPFNGLRIESPESLTDLRQYAAENFVELIQPYFIEFVEKVRQKALSAKDKSAEISIKTKQVEKTLVYLTIKADGDISGERLKEVLGAIYKSLENSGVQFEVKRADAYPQK